MATRPLRIALVAPPFLPVPPPAYAGTERVIAALAIGLHERGHRVTVYASGDSVLPCDVEPVVPEALWRVGFRGDSSAYVDMAIARAWEDADRYDVIHAHVETAGFVMARYCPTPVVSTLHRRLDVGGVAELIDRFPEIPLIAISESQRRWHEAANWVATIHHGLDFSGSPTGDTPGEYLLFVGRISPEKGVAEAIEVATRTGRRLVMAAKVYEPEERELFAATVEPAIEAGVVDWRGEVDTAERDRLMAGAYATLMLGGWPEPFGLVAIESMATGTPVIARRSGGCTETIEHGTTGFLVDDVQEAIHAVSRIAELNRHHIAAYARGRFSIERMVSRNEQVYETLVRETTSIDAADRSSVVGLRPSGRVAAAAPTASIASVAARHTRNRRSSAEAASSISDV